MKKIELFAEKENLNRCVFFNVYYEFGFSGNLNDEIVMLIELVKIMQTPELTLLISRINLEDTEKMIKEIDNNKIVNLMVIEKRDPHRKRIWKWLDHVVGHPRIDKSIFFESKDIEYLKQLLIKKLNSFYDGTWELLLLTSPITADEWKNIKNIPRNNSGVPLFTEIKKIICPKIEVAIQIQDDIIDISIPMSNKDKLLNNITRVFSNNKIGIQGIVSATALIKKKSNQNETTGK